jgi:hypothetical protein
MMVGRFSLAGRCVHGMPVHIPAVSTVGVRCRICAPGWEESLQRGCCCHTYLLQQHVDCTGSVCRSSVVLAVCVLVCRAAAGVLRMSAMRVLLTHPTHLQAQELHSHCVLLRCCAGCVCVCVLVCGVSCRCSEDERYEGYDLKLTRPTLLQARQLTCVACCSSNALAVCVCWCCRRCSRG